MYDVVIGAHCGADVVVLGVLWDMALCVEAIDNIGFIDNVKSTVQGLSIVNWPRQPCDQYCDGVGRTHRVIIVSH